MTKLPSVETRVGVKIVRISERNLELNPIFNVICC